MVGQDAEGPGAEREDSNDSLGELGHQGAMWVTEKRRVSKDSLEPSPDVWLHVYHCDAYTGFLNKACLAARDMGIYHAGVEVFGEEWSFQYFEDTWYDPSISGLIRCRPKEMGDYDYQESINLGQTPLSRAEVEHMLMQLHYDWPACSYHLTKNNCLTFAEVLVGKLRVPEPFPQRLKSILEASHNNSSVDSIVECSWSWVKWSMMRKYPPDPALVAGARDDQQQGGPWAWTCGGCCPSSGAGAGGVGDGAPSESGGSTADGGRQLLAAPAGPEPGR